VFYTKEMIVLEYSPKHAARSFNRKKVCISYMHLKYQWSVSDQKHDLIFSVTY